MFRMVPGRRQQVRLYIEICRVPAGGVSQSSRQTGVLQAAHLLSGVSKQETGGGPTCEEKLHVMACRARLLSFITHRKGQAGVSDSSNNKTRSAVRRNSPWRAPRTHGGFYCPVPRKYAALNSRYQQRSQDVWYVSLR